MNKQPEIDGVSVVICCYNSSERIIQTLHHLALQEVPEEIEWEIILVDNNSTDNTAAVALEQWDQLINQAGILRSVNENKQGQMFARIRGAKEAKYECIVFCDDDNWLQKNYIAEAKKALELDPEIGAAGGQNFPVTNAEKFPEWFEEYKTYYATGIPADQSGDITERGYIVGAGMVTHKSLFLKIFSEEYPTLLSGRTASNLSTGDDFEYCKRLLILGYKLYYSSELKLRHFIPPERLTEPYLSCLMEGINQSRQNLSVYDEAIYVIRSFRKKNKIRMLLQTPVRIFLTTLGLSKRNPETEKRKLFYLSPFQMMGSPEEQLIKRFFQNNT